MPAPSPDQILDSPPPLTPDNLTNWPYDITPFPASDLVQSVTIGHPAGASGSVANKIPNRVE